MRIAVDLDGVLADTMVTVCHILNMKRSTRLKPESFDRWKAWQTAGISKEEFFRALDESWFQWENVPPTEQELDVKVGRLLEFGSVDIVTGRSLATVDDANSWLKKHLIPFNSFVRTNDSTKAKVILDYDLYVDDSAELMSLIASRLQGSGILYLRPWNRKSPDMPRIFKAQGWDQIPDIVKRLHTQET